MPVYMIRAGEDGPVKIGRAEDPKERLSNLQVGHWEKLRIIRLFDGSVDEEAALHARFLGLHIKGEWHSFSQEMMQDVGLRELALPKTERLSKYDPALRAVLENVGGPTLLAAHLGIGASAVTQWTKIPAKHIYRIEALTGLPGSFIRPDLYAPITQTEAA